MTSTEERSPREIKSAELFDLLKAHRGTDVMQRITLFVVTKTGKKLADYMESTATDEEKIALIDEIIQVVTKNEWSKLPKIPAGQAQATNGVKPTPSPAATATPTPAPAPVKATPAPAPAPVAPPPPADEPATPEVDNAFVEDEEPSDPLAIITAQLAKLAKQPAAKSLTEEQVRRIVRAELANVFAKVSAVLANNT